jgi:HAD superfamily hydrolase (TIGR01509 family)
MIEVVIFDWGDTVMRDFPQYAGSMVDWPQVEAMPGIRDALHVLAVDYRLVLATNAAASGAEKARAALARVGLDAYFTHVLTARELGVSKPDPAFFERLLEVCGCVPHRAVMVGDNFRTDIVGAKHASLRAVWYNLRGESPPPDVPIEPDATIHDLAELAATIRRLDRRAAGEI